MPMLAGSWQFRSVIALRCLGTALSLAIGGAQGAETLLELQKLALERDPDYRTAAFARDGQLAQHDQAFGALLPTVNLEASSTGTETKPIGPSTIPGRPDIDFNTKRWEFTATQPIFRSELFVSRRQSDSRVKQAEADLAAARQDLVVRLSERYFAVLRAVDELGLARAEADALGKQLDFVKMRLEFGLVAITDVNEAQAAHDTARARVLDAENALANARDQLKTITGEYPARLAPLGAKLTLVAPSPPEVERWTETASKQNLKLLAANFNAESARQEIRKSEAGHLPTLDLVARANREAINGGTGGPSDFANKSLALQLAIPIFRGGQVLARTRESRAQYAQAIERLEKERRSSERDAREAYFGVNTNISKVAVLERAVRSHESAVEATQLGYQLNHRTAIDVVNAQRELFRARRDLAAARYEYVLNVLRLKRAAGTLEDADVEKVNEWLDLGNRVHVAPRFVAALASPLPARPALDENRTANPGQGELRLRAEHGLGRAAPASGPASRANENAAGDRAVD